jgi:hypothetical protein
MGNTSALAKTFCVMEAFLKPCLVPRHTWEEGELSPDALDQDKDSRVDMTSLGFPTENSDLTVVIQNFFGAAFNSI